MWKLWFVFGKILDSNYGCTTFTQESHDPSSYACVCGTHTCIVFDPDMTQWYNTVEHTDVYSVVEGIWKLLKVAWLFLLLKNWKERG